MVDNTINTYISSGMLLNSLTDLNNLNLNRYTAQLVNYQWHMWLGLWNSSSLQSTLQDQWNRLTSSQLGKHHPLTLLLEVIYTFDLYVLVVTDNSDWCYVWQIKLLDVQKMLIFLSLPYRNIITVYTTTTKSSSILQNLLAFLLQLTEMGYYILNGRY